MKQKAAGICLFIGIGCLLGAFIPGQMPLWSAIAAVFAISGVVFGSRWIRISGATLGAVAVVFIILEIQAWREDKRITREFQQVLQAREAKTAELRWKLQSISIADGISKSEAELIAECYFHENVGCGAFTGIQDGGPFWVVEGFFGYSAKPINGFHIDKDTGKITSLIDPRHTTIAQMLR